MLLHQNLRGHSLRRLMAIVDLVTLGVPKTCRTATLRTLSGISPSSGGFLTTTCRSGTSFLISLSDSLLGRGFSRNARVIAPTAFLSFVARGET